MKYCVKFYHSGDFQNGITEGTVLSFHEEDFKALQMFDRIVSDNVSIYHLGRYTEHFTDDSKLLSEITYIFTNDYNDSQWYMRYTVEQSAFYDSIVATENEASMYEEASIVKQLAGLYALEDTLVVGSSESIANQESISRLENEVKENLEQLTYEDVKALLALDISGSVRRLMKKQEEAYLTWLAN